MQEGPAKETPPVREQRRWITRADVGAVGSFVPYVFLDWGIEFMSGRSFRPLGSLVWFLFLAAVIAAWSSDIGFRKGAVLLLFVPFYGLAVQGRAVYRILSLPERNWTGLFPDRWTRGFKTLVVVGLLFSGLIIWDSLRRADISLDRTFEESVAVELRSGFAARRGDRTLFLAHHKGLGFLVKLEGSSSNREAQWWEPRRHWYGSDWAPMARGPEIYRSFDSVTCTSKSPHPYCLSNLPEDAVFFEFDVAGTTYSGSASAGVGVVFASPNGDLTAWRAFNEDGVLIAGYSIDLTPHSAGSAKPVRKAAKPSIPKTPSPSPTTS